MKHSIKLLAAAAILIAALGNTAFAGNARKYTGNAHTEVMGKTEDMGGLVLSSDGIEAEKTCHLEGYAAMGFKDVSITAKLTTDNNGKITSASDIVLKGCPAKIKEVTGTLSDKVADITLTGKAGGMFNFKVVYKGSAQ